MKLNSFGTILAAISIGSALSGCGSGSSGGSTVNSLLAGRSALNNLASGQQTPSAAALSDAVSLFQQAVQQNGNDTTARFGDAISLAGLVGFEMDGFSPGSSGTSSGSVGSGISSMPVQTVPLPPTPPGLASTSTTTTSLVPSTIPPAPPNYNGVPQTSPPDNSAGLIWNLNTIVSNPLSLMSMLSPITDLRYGLMPFAGYEEDNSSQREQMLTQLNQADADLTSVESDASFTYQLTLNSGKTVTIGIPEVQLFHAYIDTLRVQLAFSLAYIRSVSGSSNVPLPAIGKPPVDLNGDGKLEPNEYLPPSPYLTLRSATYFTTAQQALAGTTAEETNGIAGVLARPSDGSGGYLIPNSTQVNQLLSMVQKTIIPTLQQLSTGPTVLQMPIIGYGPLFAAAQTQLPTMATTSGLDIGQIPYLAGGGSTDAPVITLPADPVMKSVTINLTAWFSNPPPDLKVFAPTYPINSNGHPILSQGVYPDPTFGGLFPDGLPTSFLL